MIFNPFTPRTIENQEIPSSKITRHCLRALAASIAKGDVKRDYFYLESSAESEFHSLKSSKQRHLLVGDDFRFGKGRSGDFALLQTHAEQSNFDVERYDTINISGSRVSSTRIREYLAAGELSKAAELLGHPYHISGRVVHGEKVGRQLGFPTANIALHKHRPPLRGVFAVIAHDRTTGQSFAAVANLGERPTVGGRRLLLEVHALDSDVDLYGHHMQIEFIEFVRAEQKFDSLDALKQAISNDSDTASRILNSNPQFTNLSNRIH